MVPERSTTGGDFVTSVRGWQPVWLPFYVGQGWKTIEAKNASLGIEVVLREIAWRKYSYEIVADGRRLNGQLGVFFPDYFEITGGLTNLRMTEHAYWLITGQLETPGCNGGVTSMNLRIDGDFEKGLLVASGNGLNLSIDANSIRGQIDASVYPKEVTGVIAAFSMALFQGNPNYSDWVQR